MTLLDFDVMVHSQEMTCGQIRTLGGISSHISIMHGHILMKLTTVTHYHLHVTLIVVGSKDKVTDNIFQRMHFSG